MSDNLSPIKSAAHSLKEGLKQIDIAESHLPKSYDPALDPANQHTHEHHRHGWKPAGPPDIAVSPQVSGRVEIGKDVPQTGLHYPGTQGSEFSQYNKAGGVNEKMMDIGSNSNSLEEAHIRDLESQEKASTLTPRDRLKRLYRKYTWVVVTFWGIFFTAWWISIIAQDDMRHKWLIPTVLWILFEIRLITFYVPTRPLLMAANWVWKRTFIRCRDMIPQKFWIPIEALLVVMTVLVTTFASPETDSSTLRDRGISFFGYVVFYAFFYAVSNHRSKIQWHTVLICIWFQFIIGLFVLRTKAGYDFFNWISFIARRLLEFAQNGVAFLSSDAFAQGTSPFTAEWFIVSTLSSLVFFVAFVHILYYFGIIQWCVRKIGAICFWLMQISGSESIVVAATPFFGQGECAVLIKPFLPHATEAEIFQFSVCSFATISGSVLNGYMSMGVPGQALITSCVMSIPASVAAAKLAYPETEESLTMNHVVMPEDPTAGSYNVVHAFSNGAVMGLEIAFSMGANVMCMIALVALIDVLLTWFGGFWKIYDPDLTLEVIGEYLFYPVAWLVGVQGHDILKTGKLMAYKMVQNEFVAYSLMTAKNGEFSDMGLRSKILTMYSICGFSNFGSMAIQIGVLSGMAPLRKGSIAAVVFPALFVGMFSTFSSAAVAGMVMTDLSKYASTLDFN